MRVSIWASFTSTLLPAGRYSSVWSINASTSSAVSSFCSSLVRACKAKRPISSISERSECLRSRQEKYSPGSSMLTSSPISLRITSAVILPPTDSLERRTRCHRCLMVSASPSLGMATIRASFCSGLAPSSRPINALRTASRPISPISVSIEPINSSSANSPAWRRVRSCSRRGRAMVWMGIFGFFSFFDFCFFAIGYTKLLLMQKRIELFGLMRVC